MELEKWLEKYNIKSMILKNCKFYLNQYKEEDDVYKYISAKVRLEYDDTTFAEYEAIYDFEGNLEDDYLRYC